MAKPVDIAEREGMRGESIWSNNFMKVTPTHAGSWGLQLSTSLRTYQRSGVEGSKYSTSPKHADLEIGAVKPTKEDLLASSLRAERLRKATNKLLYIGISNTNSSKPDVTSRYCFLKSGIFRVHHFKQGIPYSTSSFGNMSVCIFWEGEEDFFIG